jgi:circadian clock protein KaiC
MITEGARVTIERLKTGSDALDRILGGGLPARSVNVIAGEPGSGKTVFALQLLFHFAREGKKSLYFTTLSEPAVKLVAFMQHFSFFQPALMNDLIQILDIGATVREGDVERTLTSITDRVEENEPDVVVIDSFKAVGDLLADRSRARIFVYDLAVHMVSWGATTLLVGEYLDDHVGTSPEFAIADGIVRFSSRRTELTAMRELDILKLRGSNYITGRHFFEIGPDGMTFYPRVRGPEAEDPPRRLDDRVATGIAGLDRLLDGGLPRASGTIVQGGTGTGKTLLGLQFLIEGASRGEAGIFFSLEESRNQLCEVAASYGWDVAALEARGLLTIVYTSPVELSTDAFLDRARSLVERVAARRAVIDSLSSLALGVISERRFKELVYALTRHFRLADVTLMMTMEIAELLGSGLLSGYGVSFAADNLIQLRYVEVGARLERGLSVLKARGVRHGTEVRWMKIGARGIEVEVEVEVGHPSQRGVLTGGRRTSTRRAR